MTTTLVLAEDLLALAKGKRLHTAVARALARVQSAHSVLDEASARPPEGTPTTEGDGPDVFLALVAARKAFASLEAMLVALASLPEGEPSGESARELLEALFGAASEKEMGNADGLVVEGRRLMERARSKELKKAVAATSASPLVKVCASALTTLAKARASRSRAPEAEDERGRVVRDAYQELGKAIRAYANVVQAAAVLDETVEVAVLLAPLANEQASQEQKRAARAHKEAEGAEDEAPPSVAA